MKISNILLSPQEQLLDKLSFCKSSVKSMQEWINNLNTLQLGSYSKALCNAIIEISELKCSETLRFDLIQVIHSSIENTLNNLEKHYFNQSLITNDRNEQIIELALLLRTQFAKIYINIAQQSHNILTEQKISLFAFQLKKNFQTARIFASYYALQQLGRLLYQQQTLYSTPRPGQWLIAHQLMSCAIQYHFNSTNINLLQGTHYPLKNINEAYAQLILLDIFNNNQIRPSESQGLYLCTFDWAKLIHISAKETINSRYIIDSNKDLAPVYNAHQEHNFKPDIFISTQSLLEYLSNNEGWHKENLSDNEKKFLTPALHFHIHNLLTTKAERRHERYEYSTQIKICFGVSVAHYYLSKGKNFIETLNTNFNDNTQYETRFINADSTPFKQNIKSLERETRKIYQVDVLDISVNGYRIKWTGVTPATLKTGEFILVQENSQSPWRGGVIRWIKQSTDKKIEMGLEILAQDIAPCAIHLQANQQNDYFPALLMQSTQLDDVSTHLIVSGMNIIKEKQTILLHLKDQELKVYLTKPILITQSFTCFDFELLNEQQKPSLNRFIQKQLNEVKNQDQWDALE
ncbi:GTPase [Acinetobacter sp. ANC 4558]|uniref:GTPase n=1 Tax=Acinetobacter sp. ANC 4558 TaxID=1977876 RepID=UPI000A3341A1|nr:GTPase [Acinetobacter sp. ANC 4558]OTG86416.1 GTPase [Acinetobacter sp. ANC 4558]